MHSLSHKGTGATAEVEYLYYLQVTTNPSAVGGCSCKSSFMVKQ